MPLDRKARITIQVAAVVCIMVGLVALCVQRVGQEVRVWPSRKITIVKAVKFSTTHVPCTRTRRKSQRSWVFKRAIFLQCYDYRMMDGGKPRRWANKGGLGWCRAIICKLVDGRKDWSLSMTRNGVGRCFTRLLDQGQILFFFFSPGRFVLNFASRASFFQCFSAAIYTLLFVT